jgi:hypothetical protein
MSDEVAKVIGIGLQTVGTILVAWLTYKHTVLEMTMKKLEKNTNSIKDALVAETAVSNLAKGKLEAREEMRAEAEKNKKGE